MKKFISCLIIVSLLILPSISYAQDLFARVAIRRLEEKIDNFGCSNSIPINNSYGGWTVIDKQMCDRYTSIFVIENESETRKAIIMSAKCIIIVGDKVKCIPRNNNHFFFTNDEKIERIK